MTSAASIAAPVAAAERRRPLGFWACWALTVGTMIGSGIFTLPAVLAPYGLMSFGGWLIAAGGSILLALTLARLAARTTQSGGPYIYARDGFGRFTAFLMAWGYWASYWTAIPAIAIAFVGYLPVFFPALAQNPPGQFLAALALVWTVTAINLRGVREAGFAQIAMTVLKLLPLGFIVALAAVGGTPDHLPAANPSGAPIGPTLAATALLTMWAFSGLEAGCLPAEDVRDPARTIPRAVVAGTLTVTAVYLAASAAVMLLVPAHVLTASTAPFADAARQVGTWGPALVAAGALVATAGALNGCVFVSGQLPMAVAEDGLAPRAFAARNAGAAPHAALLVSAVLGTLLLAANYARGLMGAFTFLLTMATLAFLVPLMVAAAAEARHSWRKSPAWALVAGVAAAFCLFAIVGSGIEAIGWGALLFASGAPLYFLLRRRGLAQP
jgi:APA family basic amino acid/polyamine antiporter